jgi:hypothetical protein
MNGRLGVRVRPGRVDQVHRQLPANPIHGDVHVRRTFDLHQRLGEKLTRRSSEKPAPSAERSLM